AQYTEYTQITVDISNYTDGGQHTFGVSAVQDGGSNILFDSFNLVVDGNSSVGFDQQINGERDFALYPNPADAQINLHFGQRLDGEATVRILDSNGRVVSEQLVGGIRGKLLSLETSWMPVGMYVVEVENGAELIRERISIVH
ncbi:MAG: T9SS type A sorting domain-containing protein, partial [Flavobacteriales bacterium]